MNFIVHTVQQKLVLLLNNIKAFFLVLAWLNELDMIFFNPINSLNHAGINFCSSLNLFSNNIEVFRNFWDEKFVFYGTILFLVCKGDDDFVF